MTINDKITELLALVEESHGKMEQLSASYSDNNMPAEATLAAGVNMAFSYHKEVLLMLQLVTDQIHMLAVNNNRAS